MQKYLNITLFCVFILFSGYAPAQQEEQNYLGGSFGISDFHLRDDYASPNYFGGIGITPSLQYLRKEGANRYEAEAFYYYDNLTTEKTNFHTISWRGNLSLRYLYHLMDIKIMGKSIGLFYGGSIASFTSISQYHYLLKAYNIDKISTVSWYINHSLNMDFRFEYNINARHFISAQISVPVVGNISRPEYSPSENYSYTENVFKIKVFGKTVFFPNNYYVYSRLTYQAPLAGILNMQLDYEFFFFTYNKPKETGMFMNSIRAGLFFCF